MKFKSKKDNLFSLVILGINSFLFGVTAFAILKGKMQLVEYCTLCIILGVVFLLFWLYYGTSYRLSKNGLIYKSGPFHGKISIIGLQKLQKEKRFGWAIDLPLLEKV